MKVCLLCNRLKLFAWYLGLNEQAVYHVISRTAVDGYPLGDLEKEFLVDVVRKKSRIYFVDVLGYSHHGKSFSSAGPDAAGNRLYR